MRACSMPWWRRAYSAPMRANWTSHSGAQSTVAPTSRSRVGVASGPGIGVTMAGRAIPRMRPMRSRALAMVAPVLPALTMASARPSRTASAQRTSDESFLRRTLLAGSSSMATTSPAWSSSTLAASDRESSPSSSGATTGSWPTSSTLMPGLGRQQGAGHDLGRGPVTAHGVDRHQRAPPGGRGRGRLRRRHRCRSGLSHLQCHVPPGSGWVTRPRRPGARRTTRSWGRSRGAASSGGSAGRPNGRGRTARQFEARRLRLLALGVFLLGTAIEAPQLLNQLGSGRSDSSEMVRARRASQRGSRPSLPQSQGGFGCPPETVAVGAARRAESQAVVGAERDDRAARERSGPASGCSRSISSWRRG